MYLQIYVLTLKTGCGWIFLLEGETVSFPNCFRRLTCQGKIENELWWGKKSVSLCEGQICYPLQYTATHCNILQHTATHCNKCKTLQNTAKHCNTLQYTATRCNTLRQTCMRDSARGDVHSNTRSFLS